jgi:CRP/FNR family transcriptional regulator, cyclic AMP receptor protein
MKVPGLFYNAKTFKDVPAGTVIFEEGSSGEEMFGVVEGEVEVRLPNGAVRRIGPEDTFGEMAIVDFSPRSGTAVAVTDAKLAVIDRRMFLFLVQETPMFALQVMSSMAGRVRDSETGLRPKSLSARRASWRPGVLSPAPTTPGRLRPWTG